MRTLLQCLVDYPDALIEAIAVKRGVELAASDRRAVIDQLSAVLVDGTGLQGAVAASTPAAIDALRELIGSGGWMTSAKFMRSFGPIRAFGPARLRRETPWESPIGASEELWYSGLISRGFAPIAGRSVEVVFIPSDIMAQLGLEGVPGPEFAVPEHPASASQAAVGDAFLEDMCTLLSTVDSQRLPVDFQGNWTDKAASLAGERLQLHSPVPDHELLRTGTPIALLVHLATRLGWLRTARTRVQLQPAPVREWLEASRDRQRQTLWDAWTDDPEWDDLCRMPGLRCEGMWSHEPQFARRSILGHLRECTPGSWYKIMDFVAAVKNVDTDFLRPEGNYDSWYIRDLSSGEYLRGFEQWERVEGCLIAYIIMGPAHWMSETTLGVVHGDGRVIGPVPDSSWFEAERLSSLLFSVSAHGDPSLNGSDKDGQSLESQAVTVLPDFRIQVPPRTSMIDRFRIGRFADWLSSQPIYNYRVTQTSLARASERGIDPALISNFLTRVTQDQVPPNVLAALNKWKVH